MKSNSLVVIQICLLTIFLSSLTTADLSLEQQFQQLKESFNGLALQNVKQQEQIDELTTKVGELEERVEQQAKFLVKDNTNSKLNDYQLSTSKSNTILRTCYEIRSVDPSATSDWYWIDPDGQGVGEGPIYVFCDAATGSTSVPHDSEMQIDVGHCADPGCFSKTITYSASSRQMETLAALSNECHQSIRYDCNYAPLELNNVQYSWWNDRNGKPQYFWSGSNGSVHTCQCGIDNNCVDPYTKCNCDSSLPVDLSDSGVITDKNILPVTKLNFGRTILSTSSGICTVGRFECTGRVAVSGMPTSCADLWHIGHTLSGLYSVKGVKQVEEVYCDFTKLPTKSGFQTWIGYTDVKSVPTYFYVQRNSEFNTTKTPIPFQLERTNVGGAMNLSSGIFTAPRTGSYFFSLSATVRFPKSGASWMNFELRLNGNTIGEGIPHTSTGNNDLESFSLQSTLKLQAGDKVWLQINYANNNAFLEEEQNHMTHFTGWLLEEDIFP